MNYNLKPRRPKSKPKPEEIKDIPLSMAQFEGLLTGIDEFYVVKIKPKRGTRVKWFITWREYDKYGKYVDLWLGFMSAWEYRENRTEVKFYDLASSDNNLWRIMVNRVIKELQAKGLLPNTPEAKEQGADPKNEYKQESSTMTRLKGGRPPDPDNQWAYEQVNSHARNKREVYLEWKKRKAEHGTLPTGDPLEAFRKAVSPKKEKNPGI